MTSVAVFKVDDLGRRPLLIGGVSGIVYITTFNKPLSNISFILSTSRVNKEYLEKILFTPLSFIYPRLFHYFFCRLITSFSEVFR